MKVEEIVMDIFTTQLTRVVPVPIKPTEMKVKALLKEAATGKLKEDPDHLENHDYYFIQSSLGKGREEEKSQGEPSKQEGDSQSSPDDDEPKHLDIYV